MEASLRFERRGNIDPARLDALFAAAWGRPKSGYEKVFAHSFTWVAAWDGDELVGFVNVAWDGDVHFVLLDTTVHPDHQRRGIARRLVEEAIAACRARRVAPRRRGEGVDGRPLRAGGVQAHARRSSRSDAVIGVPAGQLMHR